MARTWLLIVYMCAAVMLDERGTNAVMEITLWGYPILVGMPVLIFIEDEDLPEPITPEQMMAWEKKHVGNEYEGGYMMMEADNKGGNRNQVQVTPSKTENATRRQTYTKVETGGPEATINYQCPAGYTKEYPPMKGIAMYGWMYGYVYCVCPENYWDLHKMGKPYLCSKTRPGNTHNGMNVGNHANQVSVILFRDPKEQLGYNERLSNDCRRLGIPGQVGVVQVQDPWNDKVCIALFQSDDCSTVKEYVIIQKDTILWTKKIDWRNKARSARVIAWKKCPLPKYNGTPFLNMANHLFYFDEPNGG